MPNDYFRFKQFLIKQDKCAMKVCTDACLFGAVAADRLPMTVNCLQPTANCILDIGTGTGLLSLMLAQKFTETFIDAVETDETAARQAKENFNTSVWKDRLNVYAESIQQFAETSSKKYDAVICNPPFYENDLKGENVQRNLALHSDELSLNTLIQIINKLLNDGGNFFVLLPFHRTQYFEDLLLQNDLKVREKVFIKQTQQHNYFRTIFWVDKKAELSNQSEIIIINDEKKYTDEFINLLKDYYLYL